MKRMIKCMTESELHREQLLRKLQLFASGRLKGHRKFEEDGLYFEKHSIQSMINNYIRWYNDNVRESGYGYATD